MGTRGSFVRLLLAVPLLAAAAIGGVRPAAAAFDCTGEIHGGTIKESLVVPPGEDCVLFAVTVRGGASVSETASLTAHNSEIRGSVSAASAEGLGLFYSTVRGSVTSYATSTFVDTTEVRGDVTVTYADSPFGNHVINSAIRGSLTFSNNSTTYQNTVSQNDITVNLTCENNDLPPVNSGNTNTVGGVKSGQCAGL